MAKKQKKRTKPQWIKSLQNGLSVLSEFYNEPNNKRAIRVFALLFALFILIAQLSFLATWQNDWSVQYHSLSELADENGVSNVLGYIGAWIGFVTVLKGFGLGALALPILLLTIIVDRILERFKVNALQRTNLMVFLGLWTSLLMAAIHPQSLTVYSGRSGYGLWFYLAKAIGTYGVWFALLGSATLCFIIMRWYRFIPKRKPAAEGTEEQAAEDVAETVELATESATVSVALEETPEPAKSEPIAAPATPEPVAQPELITPKPAAPKATPKSESSDLDIKVEVAKTEEVTENQKLKDFGEYDPTLDLSKFKLPPLNLLKQYGDGTITFDKEEIENNKNRIVETLLNYKIGISDIKATIGPTVTLYEIVPAAGIRISKIKNLEDDIALSLAALGIRIIAPIPGKGTVGIEVPNANPQIVSMHQVIASKKFQENSMELPVAIGKTITNENFVFDLAKMPHLLMAGATGQGKSVGLNAILASLLYKKHHRK